MKLHKPTRTVVELAPEPQEERVVFNASDTVVETSGDSAPEAAIPALIRTSGGEAVPPLESVRRVMKRIELSSSQPTAEVEAVAEPVSGEDLLTEEQTAIQEELQNEQTSGNPVLTRVSRRQVVELQGPAEQGSTDSGDVSEDNGDAVAEPESSGAIPPLEPIQKSEEAIPPLVIVRDGGALPADLTEIPKLEEYNKMEVAHLLMGRSVEDEEVVLLQSFSERFIRTKKLEEFEQSILARITAHYSIMIQQGLYDFPDRRENRSVVNNPVSSVLAQRGVEKVFSLVDSGAPTVMDINYYIEDNDGINLEEAIQEMKDKGMYQPQSSVYTWALVRIKIGHDFGAFKLSELMPPM